MWITQHSVWYTSSTQVIVAVIIMVKIIVIRFLFKGEDIIFHRSVKLYSCTMSNSKIYFLYLIMDDSIDICTSLKQYLLNVYFVPDLGEQMYLI